MVGHASGCRCVHGPKQVGGEAEGKERVVWAYGLGQIWVGIELKKWLNIGL